MVDLILLTDEGHAVRVSSDSPGTIISDDIIVSPKPSGGAYGEFGRVWTVDSQTDMWYAFSADSPSVHTFEKEAGGVLGAAIGQNGHKWAINGRQVVQYSQDLTTVLQSGYLPFFPGAIAAGKNDDLWLTEEGTDDLIRTSVFDPGSIIARYPSVVAGGEEVSGITVTPAGDLFLAERTTGKILKLAVHDPTRVLASWTPPVSGKITGIVAATWLFAALPPPPQLVSPEVGSAKAADRLAVLRFVPHPLSVGHVVEYRRQDTPDSITSVEVAQPLNEVIIESSVFSVGVWEWRARSVSDTGAMSSWSNWSQFYAVPPPPPPTILYPHNNGIASINPGKISWSAAGQGAFEINIFHELQNVYTSGIVSSTSRTATVPHPINGRTETASVRVQHEGVWSDWASVSYTVDYQPPLLPAITEELTGEGWVNLTIAHPATDGMTPPVVSQEIHRQQSRDKIRWTDRNEKPDAYDVFESDSLTGHVDRLVADKMTYRYRTRVFGDNSTATNGWWVNPDVVTAHEHSVRHLGLQLQDGMFGINDVRDDITSVNGVAFSPEGDLYVLDSTQKKLYPEVGDPALLSAPGGQLDGMDFGPDDRIYAVDSAATRVWIFRRDGSRTGTMGAGMPLVDLCFVGEAAFAVTPDTVVFYHDFLRRRVGGQYPAPDAGLTGVATYDGRLFVSSAFQVFELDYDDPSKALRTGAIASSIVSMTAKTGER